MKQISKIHYFTLFGGLLGATAGYLYYRFVGCASGTCAITSSPTISTLYGAVMGGLFVNSIISLIYKNKNHGK
jgi:hypothetical protein